MTAIEASELRRTFKNRAALDGISFSVAEGEVFGFLGPNGAGKTTTIRILTGQLLPGGGSARVAGFDCAREAQKIKPLIGVVFEYQNLYERLSGRENLAFFAQLYGVPARRVEEALGQVGLQDRARDSVHAYSNGMKQRLLIARAMLHRPKILFLDEPTRGLDPAAARDLRDTIAALGQSGATVFLTTHDMEEADRLCARVAFLNEGRIVAQDTPRNLKLAHGRRRVRLVLRTDPRAEVSLSLDDPEEARRLAGHVERGEALTLHTEEATLEEVFLQLAGRTLQ